MSSVPLKDGYDVQCITPFSLMGLAGAVMIET